MTRCLAVQSLQSVSASLKCSKSTGPGLYPSAVPPAHPHPGFRPRHWFLVLRVWPLCLSWCLVRWFLGPASLVVFGFDWSQVEDLFILNCPTPRLFSSFHRYRTLILLRSFFLFSLFLPLHSFHIQESVRDCVASLSCYPN